MPALHIISFDIPYPPNYGGVVDVFYKIKALSEAGVNIHLHCFAYGRPESEELKKYCKTVHYYSRKTGPAGISLRLPYMLYSRRDKELLLNLQKIKAPILFEGVHTTYFIKHPGLADRFKIVRNQNLEQEYFALLARRSKGLISKVYYYIEAKLLKKYEAGLQAADAFFTVAEHDYLFFKEAYPGKIHEYIPSFQPFNSVETEPGTGAYCLYQGNLGHPENIEAAEFLLKKVCPRTNTPFIFAGKDPSSSIIRLAEKLENCTVIANPEGRQMEDLVNNAQIHILPTFQATGLKLKLLHALFKGRHVLVNAPMVAGTGLDSLCHFAEEPADFVRQIETLMSLPFTQEERYRRDVLLKEKYNNTRNALRIKTYLR